jgi:hypothetical protein
MSDRTVTATSMTTLMRGLVDYAGLFPPAGLGMAAAVERYARYRTGPDAWALGRFVVPASRLAELEAAMAALPAARHSAGPWRLSALASLPLERDLDTVRTFNTRHERGEAFVAQVDSLEIKVASPDDVRRACDEASRYSESDGGSPAGPTGGEAPRRLQLYLECRPGEGLGALLAETHASGAGVKFRTGGVTPDAVPLPRAAATFIARCAELGLQFKATAGLHHPIRSVRPLTYERDAPQATMHGFLNVFVAAALADACHAGVEELIAVIEEQDAGAFLFTGEDVTWRGRRLTAAQIAASRHLARSFGSCSFEEPLDDLRTLGLL